jgi:hypothetical protein
MPPIRLRPYVPSSNEVMLPAVFSLKALRELAKESQANDAYLGFGDPLLDGEPAKYKDEPRDKRNCPRLLV